MPKEAATESWALDNDARDGWLFIGIGQACLVMGLIGMYFSSYRSREDPLLVLSVLSIACWAAMSPMGVYKLIRSRRRLPWGGTPWLLVALAYLVLAAIVLVPVIIVAACTVHYPESASIVAGAGLAIYAIGRHSPITRSYWNALTAMTIATVSLSTVWIVCAARAAVTMDTPPYTDPYTAATRGLLVVWLILLILNGVALYFSAKTREDAAPLRKPRWLFWTCVALLAGSAAVWICASFTGRILFCLLPVLTLAAVALSVWFSGARRSKVRLAAALVVSLLLLDGFVLPLATLGSVVHMGVFNYEQGVERRDEAAWYLPEVIRGPVASLLLWSSPSKAYPLWGLGLPGIAQLRIHATQDNTTGWDCISFLRWYERDPENALAMALSVAPKVPFPDTQYDYSAGFVIGRFAPAADVQARLGGAYGQEMMTGVIAGALERPDGGDIVTPRLLRQTLVVPHNRGLASSVWMVIARDAEYARDEILKLMADESPLGAKLLEESWYAVQYLPDKVAYPLILAFLRCNNGTARARILDRREQLDRAIAMDSGNQIVEQVLLAAQGKLPGSTPEERRVAARYLAGMLHESYIVGWGMRPVPPAEAQAIDALVERVRAKLSSK